MLVLLTKSGGARQLCGVGVVLEYLTSTYLSTGTCIPNRVFSNYPVALYLVLEIVGIIPACNHTLTYASVPIYPRYSYMTI